MHRWCDWSTCSLVDALRRGASDIHIEPYEKELRIRFRIDGVLYDVMHPPLKLRDAYLAREDHVEARYLGKEIAAGWSHQGQSESRRSLTRARFSCLNVAHTLRREVVLRLLDKENLMLDMTKLGFEPESLVKFQRNISKPYGMVLVTGPTGSGKQTSLFCSAIVEYYSNQHYDGRGSGGVQPPGHQSGAR